MNNLNVSLYSSYNFLSVSVLENLLSKNCYVNIISSDMGNWEVNTARLSGNKRFALVDSKKNRNISSSYNLFILGFGEDDPYDELRDFLKAGPLSASKTLILLPFEKYSFEENSHFNFSANLGVIYLGDLLGPRMDLDNNLLITRLVRSIYFKRKIHLAVGELLYPLFVGDAAKTICRWLFSFGPYGKETILLGQQTSGTDFWRETTTLVGDLKLSYNEEVEARVLPRNIEIKVVNGNLKFMLTQTFKWLVISPPKKVLRFGETQPVKKVKKKRVYPKYLKPLVLAALFVLLFPVVMMLLTGGAFYLSYRQFVAGNHVTAQNIMLFAKTFSVISKEESAGLSYIPLLGRVYNEFDFIGDVGKRTADMAVTAMPMVRTSSDLINKILGNEIYDPSAESSVLSEGMDTMYVEISLLQADTMEASSRGTLAAGFLTKRINFDKFKNLAMQGKTLTQNLPDLIGKNGPKTYLILFQNNMELRPTGGFIGSFGILTFDGGRISDLAVNDVYSADGQLLGHVEPPAPIKKYLGEANWWFRDSNWDPDFPTSAQRAEWFLDKEMGRSVDGVVAIDLEPIKNILKYTGPVFLPDFNLDITSENLYEKTQAEVQDNFFPGTHQKASFLTALSRSLLANLSKLTGAEKIGVLKSFYTDLEGRSIQMFIHDDSSQNAIAALNWDGAVDSPDCGQGCYGDIIGEVEANVGVNKANYFIDRKEDLRVNLTPVGIQRILTVTLKNNANPALGPSGIYKTYVRLLSDTSSQISSVKMVTGEDSQNMQSDEVALKGRNETGVYLEVLAGQTKELQFSWTTNLTTNNSFNKYGLYLRKQAGVGADPFTLTVNGGSVYNGLLAGDFFARYDW